MNKENQKITKMKVEKGIRKTISIILIAAILAGLIPETVYAPGRSQTTGKKLVRQEKPAAGPEDGEALENAGSDEALVGKRQSSRDVKEPVSHEKAAVDNYAGADGDDSHGGSPFSHITETVKAEAAVPGHMEPGAVKPENTEPGDMETKETEPGDAEPEEDTDPEGKEPDGKGTDPEEKDPEEKDKEQEKEDKPPVARIKCEKSYYREKSGICTISLEDCSYSPDGNPIESELRVTCDSGRNGRYEEICPDVSHSDNTYSIRTDMPGSYKARLTVKEQTENALDDEKEIFFEVLNKAPTVSGSVLPEKKVTIMSITDKASGNAPDMEETVKKLTEEGYDVTFRSFFYKNKQAAALGERNYAGKEADSGHATEGEGNTGDASVSSNGLTLSSWVAEGEDETVSLSWKSSGGIRSLAGYRLFRKLGEEAYTSISTWDGESHIKILNVYPYRQQLYLWMNKPLKDSKDSAGKGLLDIDSVSFDRFNEEPERYLLDDDNKYKYDVIMFGSADCNGGKDLNELSYNTTLKFIQSGRGVLFGHDSVVQNAAQRHPWLARFGELLGLSFNSHGTLDGSGTKVDIVKEGTLTSYPWKLRGTLNVPYSHSSSQYVDKEFGKNTTIWMRYQGEPKAGNYYLLSKNSVAMIQTGHSGNSNDDEKKILANTLCYLKQYTIDDHAKDPTAYDMEAPEVTGADAYFTSTDFDKMALHIEGRDKGTIYRYFVQTVPKEEYSRIITSNEVKEEMKTGIKGFAVLVNDDSSPVPELYEKSLLTGEIKNFVKAVDDQAYTDIPSRYIGKECYAHICAVDNSDNVSGQITIKLDTTSNIYDIQQFLQEEADYIVLDLDRKEWDLSEWANIEKALVETGAEVLPASGQITDQILAGEKTKQSAGHNHVFPGQKLSIETCYSDAESDPCHQQEITVSNGDSTEKIMISREKAAEGKARSTYTVSENGTYHISVKAQDDPASGNERLSDYRAWSESHTLTDGLVCSERPVLKDLAIRESQEAEGTFRITYDAYVPGKEALENKGISRVSLWWRKVGDSSWNQGELPKKPDIGCVYLLKAVATDQYGMDSLPKAALLDAQAWAMTEADSSLKVQNSVEILTFAGTEETCKEELEKVKKSCAAEECPVSIRKATADSIDFQEPESIRFVLLPDKAYEKNLLDNPAMEKALIQSNAVVVYADDTELPAETMKKNIHLLKRDVYTGMFCGMGVDYAGKYVEFSENTSYSARLVVEYENALTGQPQTSTYEQPFTPERPGTYHIYFQTAPRYKNGATGRYQGEYPIVSGFHVYKRPVCKTTTFLSYDRRNVSRINAVTHLEKKAFGRANYINEVTCQWKQAGGQWKNGELPSVLTRGETYLLKTTVTDADGISSCPYVEIIRTDDVPVPDVTAPKVTIESPSHGARIAGPVDIVGSIHDDTRLAEYSISYDNGSGKKGTMTYTDTENKSSQKLGAIDFSDLPNGVYTIMVTATDEWDNKASASVRIVNEYPLVKLTNIDADEEYVYIHGKINQINEVTETAYAYKNPGEDNEIPITGEEEAQEKGKYIGITKVLEIPEPKDNGYFDGNIMSEEEILFRIPLDRMESGVYTFHARAKDKNGISTAAAIKAELIKKSTEEDETVTEQTSSVVLQFNSVELVDADEGSMAGEQPEEAVKQGAAGEQSGAANQDAAVNQSTAGKQAGTANQKATEKQSEAANQSTAGEQAAAVNQSTAGKQPVTANQNTAGEQLAAANQPEPRSAGTVSDNSTGYPEAPATEESDGEIPAVQKEPCVRIQGTYESTDEITEKTFELKNTNTNAPIPFELRMENGRVTLTAKTSLMGQGDFTATGRLKNSHGCEAYAATSFQLSGEEGNKDITLEETPGQNQGTPPSISAILFNEDRTLVQIHGDRAGHEHTTLTCENISTGKKINVKECDDNGTIGTMYSSDFENGQYRVTLTAYDSKGTVLGMAAMLFTYTKGGQGGSVSDNTVSDNTVSGNQTDKTAPVIELDIEDDDYILTEASNLTGSIHDETALKEYRVTIIPEGEESGKVIKTGTEEIKDAAIASIDPATLANGRYRVMVEAEDKAGNRKTAALAFTVDSRLKVGNMNIGFTDLVAKLPSGSLNLQRFYNSNNKTCGDFGYGWTMGLTGMTLKENSDISRGYRQEVSGMGLSTSYHIRQTANHDVTVHYGDGTSDRFRLTLSPDTSGLVPIRLVKVGFTCQTSQGVTLELAGDNSAGLEGDSLLWEDESKYDGLVYILTMKDKTRAYLTPDKGVFKIEDSLGNTITVDENGYHGEGNKGITLTRNEEGLITSATDGNGRTVSYGYDENKNLTSFTNQAGHTVSFTYDGEHNLASITDPMGVAAARNEYDETGRLTATIDAEGNRMEYTYDVEGRTQAIQDRRGYTTVHTYDENGNILKTVDPMGTATYNTYDTYGNLLTETDGNGNTTSYAYDENGNITEITAADGTKIQNTYRQDNCVTSIRMMDKTIIAMDYDDRGRITGVTDGNRNRTAYEYTRDGRLSSITDRIGQYQKATYDAEGNVLTTTNGAGETTSYTYDGDGNCSSMTISREEDGERKTFTTRYAYDKSGNITQSTDSQGNVTAYEYDANGNQTAATDAKGRRIAYAYDSMGNMEKVTYPDGTSETFEHDANGNAIKATDRSGRTVHMDYDKLNRLVRKTYADGTSESYAYDRAGNLTSRTGAGGGETRYTYNARNLNTAITDPYGAVTTFTYDEAARLIKTVDNEGNELSHTYDGNGNILKTTYADGSSVTAEYDARNRTTSQTDASGNRTEYEYDGADRLTKVTDACGNSYSYDYDENGNLSAVTDPNGHATKYTYDGAGRVLSVTSPQGRKMEYRYDTTGNLISHKDYAGNLTAYTYDTMDRPVEKQTGGKTTAYSYEDDSLSKVTDENGETCFEYDQYGRLTKKTDAQGGYITYTYDRAGRTASLETPAGKTSYEYDLLDRVTRVIDHNGNATVYEYDSLGNRSAVRYPNGTILTYAYDPCQRLKEECLTDKNGRQLAKYTYRLGKAGERTGITEVTEDGTATEISYRYDRLNRLTKETIECGGSTLTNEYTYDRAGSRTSKETTIKGDITKIADVNKKLSAADSLQAGAPAYDRSTASTGDACEVELTEGKTTYTYNELNQLTGETSPEGTTSYEYDANGNLIRQSGKKDTAYEYDGENRLIKATVQKDGRTTTESYTYDYAGNRISRQAEGRGRTYYILDESSGLAQITAETDGNGNVTASYVLNGNERISMERGGKTSYYLHDGHGSVRGLYDKDGRRTDSYSYDAYGNLLTAEGETENDFLYTGEQYNANTGLYYLRARYMNPSTGTFISMDSYQGNLYDPVSLHKYLYVAANPVMYTDPTGYDRNLISMIVSMDIMGVLNSMMSSPLVNAGMSMLFRLRALSVVETVSAISAGVIIGMVVDDAINGADSLVGQMTAKILDNAFPLICYVVVTSEMKAVQKAVEEIGVKKYSGYSVYLLRDSTQKNKVMYVGITNDPARREKEHKNRNSEANKRHPKRTGDEDWYMQVVYSGLTETEARTMEQSLICIYTIQALSNARYEIAKKNIDGFRKEIERAATLLDVPYENLYNLVSRKGWKGE